jgi:hypothetical protein
MMRPLLWAALLSVAAGFTGKAAQAFAGQVGTLSGSTVAYIFSSGDGTLRPIQGTLGSATIGAPVMLGFTVTQALALDGRHFLASTDAGMVFVDLGSATPAVAPLDGAPSNPSLAVGSRSGTAAALYYAAQNSVLIVTGLPSSPRISQTIDVSPHARPVTRMAVNDAGRLLVYAVAGEGQDWLYVSTSMSSADRFLGAAGAVSAIALAPNDDALVADASANAVFWIKDPQQSGTPEFLAGESVGMSSPVDVTVSDNGAIVVANGGSPTILTLDANGTLLRTLSCACELSGVYRFRDSVYRLTDRTDRTVYLLDTGSGASRARLVFVPPLPSD